MLHSHRDVTAPIYAVGTSFDSGGAGGVQINWHRRQQCCTPFRNGAPGCEATAVTDTPGMQVQTQSGRVGDTVSNGVYAFVSTTPAECAPGAYVWWSDFYFRVTAWDLHGNVARSGELTISYDSPRGP